MNCSIASLLLFTHFFVFSLAYASPSQIPLSLEQAIQKDLSSSDIFQQLSNQEKLLFLHALLYKFTDSVLQMIEILTKEQLVLYLQEKPINEEIAKNIVKQAKQLKKISLLYSNVHSAQKDCFTYLQQHHEPVTKALDHVRSNGRTLTIELSIAFQNNLDMCSKALEATILSTLERLMEIQQKYSEPIEERSSDAIPSSIVILNNLVDFSRTLESLSHDMQKTAFLHIPILKLIIEPGLHLLNMYYKTIYEQLDTCTTNEYSMSLDSSQMPIFMQQLPSDLMLFFQDLMNQSV